MRSFTSGLASALIASSCSRLTTGAGVALDTIMPTQKV